MNSLAKEYEEALNQPIKYVDIPFEEWRDKYLKNLQLDTQTYQHLNTMAQLHAKNRYDRITQDVEKVTGKPSMTVREYVASHMELFEKVFPLAAVVFVKSFQ